MRVGALRGTAACVLVACNALTGADGLGVSDEASLRDEPALPDQESAETAGREARDGGAADTRADGGPAFDVDAGDDLDASDTGTPPVEAGPCVAGSVGPRYGTSAIGTVWTEENGALAPDNSRAHSNGDNPNYLFTTGYGFALPEGAEVQGIRVTIARVAEGFVADSAVRLPKGQAKAKGAWPLGPYTGPYVPTTYGSATDLWSATWTAADINSPSFGVAIKVNGSGDGHIDSIGVTVEDCVR